MACVGKQRQRTGNEAAGRLYHQHQRGEDEGDEQLAFAGAGEVVMIVVMTLPVIVRAVRVAGVRVVVVVCHG
ncbi:hypothetical protein GCM10009552_18030 [Rothia nasimurium]